MKPKVAITGEGKNARWLELPGYLSIQFGYALKMGAQIRAKLIH